MPGLGWFPRTHTNQSNGIWSAGPLFVKRGLGGCGGPIPGPVLAQPSLQGPPSRTRAVPKQTALSQAQPPRLPIPLGTSRWAWSQPPAFRLYPWRGARGRVLDTRPLRDGAAGSRCPPCLCPSPPQVPSQGEAALVSRLRMVGGWRRALFPWQLCWSGALLGAHRTGHCSPQIWAVLSQGPRGATGCWAPPPNPREGGRHCLGQ